MKLCDPKNVVLKTNHLLKGHLELFQSYFGQYEQSAGGTTYYFGDEERTIALSLVDTSKFLTKVFGTCIKLQLRGIEMACDWKARVKFLGTWKLENIILQGMTKKDKMMVEWLNAQKEWLDKLLLYLQQIDLERMVLEYKKDEKTLLAYIYPYAGALVWVKLPPVYYDLKLNEEEVRLIYQLTTVVAEFFTKTETMRESTG